MEEKKPTQYQVRHCPSQTYISINFHSQDSVGSPCERLNFPTEGTSQELPKCFQIQKLSSPVGMEISCFEIALISKQSEGRKKKTKKTHKKYSITTEAAI